MAYFRYIVDSNRFHTFKPLRPKHVDWLLQFDGRPLREKWQPLATDLDYAESLGDFSEFAAHVPVVSVRALQLLLPFVKDAVEVLPLKPSTNLGSDFCVLNAIKVIDCLDRDQSVLDVFDDTILLVDHYVLHDSQIADANIFRIKGYELGGVFVSEKFKALVEENHLTGIMWHPLP